MWKPKPTEAHLKLAGLAGTWVGTEIMHPSPWDPAGGTAEGRIENRVALGGFVVIADYEQSRDGQVTFTGHGVHTHDTARDRHVLYWFDCMGTAPNVFEGRFEGDVLTTVSHESLEGEPRSSRATYDLSEPGRLRSKMEVSTDGEEYVLFMEGDYTRTD